MQGQVPINFACPVKLGDLGLKNFSFGSVQLQSDRYVCAKDGDAGQVVVVDLHNGNAVDKKPMKADTSLMHPSKNVIALKSRTRAGRISSRSTTWTRKLSWAYSLHLKT
jgi:clathrin heavy chain